MGRLKGRHSKISHFIEAILKDGGHEVTVADASEAPPPPSLYDAVIIGASIHIHKYQSAVLRYITHHIEALNKIPGAFFLYASPSHLTMDEEHKEAAKITNDFLEHIGWKPLMTTQIAGALKYTQYDFFTRLVMKRIVRGRVVPPTLLKIMNILTGMP